MISLRALQALIFELDSRSTPEFQAAANACKVPTPRAEPAYDVAAAQAALFAHAQAVHSQLMTGYASLDKKAEEAFRFTAGLLAALVALTSAVHLRFSIWLLVAVLFWFAAATVFGLMRRGITHPGLPDIASVRNGIFCVESYQEWLAESLHKVTTAIRVINAIRSEQLDLGMALLYVGCLFLVAHCISLFVTTLT